MASDSFQRRKSHGYRNTATSRTTSWNNCEHREIKKLLSEQQLVSAWNTAFFESRGKKQISEVPFLHCAAQLFGASLSDHPHGARKSGLYGQVVFSTRSHSVCVELFEHGKTVVTSRWSLKRGFTVSSSTTRAPRLARAPHLGFTSSESAQNDAQLQRSSYFHTCHWRASSLWDMMHPKASCRLVLPGCSNSWAERDNSAPSFGNCTVHYRTLRSTGSLWRDEISGHRCRPNAAPERVLGQRI